MNFIFIFILSSFFYFSSFENKHPLHLTITNIDYNENSNQFDIAIKFYADDFAACLNHIYNKSIDFTKNDEINKNEILITRYVNKMLILRWQNKKIEHLFLKKSVYTDGCVWLYFACKSPRNFKKLEIENLLMNDFYFDQTNLLFLNYKNKKEALSFDLNKNKINISF